LPAASNRRAAFIAPRRGLLALRVAAQVALQRDLEL